jgi:hypothetical protein
MQALSILSVFLFGVVCGAIAIQVWSFSDANWESLNEGSGASSQDKLRLDQAPMAVRTDDDWRAADKMRQYQRRWRAGSKAQ